MITHSITLLLFVFGGLTALPLIQAIAPRYYSRVFNKLGELDDTTIFYARQAGLAIASIGALLIWAGFDPAIRLPVIVVAIAGKTVFSASIYFNLKKYPGLLSTALVDTIAVLVFALYLAGW